MDVSTAANAIRSEHRQRRLWRFTAPAAQLGLAVWVLAVTVGFAGLFLANSWAAYGRLMNVALSLAPEAFRNDVALQGAQHTSVTMVLVIAYLLAVMGLASAAVHRLTGATVALERHVRALRSGDYASRVQLRGNDSVHANLARELNELAARLQSSGRRV